MMRVLSMTLGLLLALAAAMPLQAQQPAAGGVAGRIAPLVDEQTIAVFHVDLSRIDPPKVVQVLGRVASLEDKEIKATNEQVKAMVDNLKALGVSEVYGVVSLDDIPFEPLI